MADSALVLNNLPHISSTVETCEVGSIIQDSPRESNLLLYEVIEVLLDVLNVFAAHMATTAHP